MQKLSRVSGFLLRSTHPTLQVYFIYLQWQKILHSNSIAKTELKRTRQQTAFPLGRTLQALLVFGFVF
jgi:hypothetical protein